MLRMLELCAAQVCHVFVLKNLTSEMLYVLGVATGRLYIHFEEWRCFGLIFYVFPNLLVSGRGNGL